MTKEIMRPLVQIAVLAAGLLWPSIPLAFEIFAEIREASETSYSALDCAFVLDASLIFSGSCRRVQDDGDSPIWYFGEGDAYFVYLLLDGADTAEAWWNGEPNAGHAHNSLGRLVDDGRCWQNPRASLCYKTIQD